jgi:hypothetical protein
MNNIKITRGDKTLASHSTDSPLSHYAQAVWVVEVEHPEPGPATWAQEGGPSMTVDILIVDDGWLICRQPDGLLIGILWSDGSYYAECLIDKKGRTSKRLRNGLSVRGTIQVGSKYGSRVC